LIERVLQKLPTDWR